jgi:hypothetical protein
MRTAVRTKWGQPNLGLQRHWGYLWRRASPRRRWCSGEELPSPSRFLAWIESSYSFTGSPRTPSTTRADPSAAADENHRRRPARGWFSRSREERLVSCGFRVEGSWASTSFNVPIPRTQSYDEQLWKKGSGRLCRPPCAEFSWRRSWHLQHTGQCNGEKRQVCARREWETAPWALLSAREGGRVGLAQSVFPWWAKMVAATQVGYSSSFLFIFHFPFSFLVFFSF